MIKGYLYIYLLIITMILMGIVPRLSHSSEEYHKSTFINPEGYSRRQAFLDDNSLNKEDKNIEYRSGVKEDNKLEMEVVLMWDYRHLNGAHIVSPEDEKKLDTGTQLRRSSIDLENEFKKNWQAKLEINFNSEDSSVEVGDAYINFTKWDYANLIIGQSKEPFGLEKLTSSNNITFMERSMTTNAFAPGSSPGLGLSGDMSQFTWAIGIYESVKQENKKDTYAITSRLTFAPWKHKKDILHLGISGSSRDMGGEKYKIEERAEVYNTEKIIISDKIPVDKMDLLGFEISLITGHFLLQTEYMSASIIADNEEDVTYKGYYMQGSYFLFGDPPKYKKGIFKEVDPEGELGTLELVSRYSVLDVIDNSKGIKASNITFGMNYYINEYIKLMSNYIKTDLKGDLEDIDDSAQALCFRIQCIF